MSSSVKTSTPDWGRFGLETQQPSIGSEQTNEAEETDSEENELFKEEQVRGYA